MWDQRPKLRFAQSISLESTLTLCTASAAFKKKSRKTSVVQANSKVMFGPSTLQFWRQKITRPWKTIFSGFAGSLSFLVPLPSCTISHACGHLRVSCCARRTTEKRETAHSLTLSKTGLFNLGSALSVCLKEVSVLSQIKGVKKGRDWL